LRHREDIEQREKEELLRLTYKYQIEVSNRNGLIAKYQETTKNTKELLIFITPRIVREGRMAEKTVK